VERSKKMRLKGHDRLKGDKRIATNTLHLLVISSQILRALPEGLSDEVNYFRFNVSTF